MLASTKQGLVLTLHGQNLHIDFLSPAFHKRLRETGQKSPLFKAIGNDKHISVLDMTAGLGRDTFLLAHRGHRVTAVEQSAELFALLSDALKRAEARYPETLSRITLLHGDSLGLIQTLPAHDIVYCDPMFPERKKSALVKKDMQIMQQLLGHGDNAEALLAAALSHAQKRTVLKRPKLSDILGKPSFSQTSKTHRFDVYL
ncbi:MAG: hypothetical protein COV52_09325 [Gammaproteobacteria bacterium CG11_big_fil_rev_8_21_14_0_20_46_22]|nr:MAG: hypothetical protein COW05_07065 [Gammaproteobacteria bacterium CG12_big_fil_rev_8_21_14_0_65_46_12]PIR10332.1 MAG: hypothetical protein COV52_09325 [Gammaproteobacteria bacterium CG11_big_fil_rev_8_21_14_0_20_46_22]